MQRQVKMVNKDKIILAYHSIGKVPHDEVGAERYCVPVEEFRKQMEYVVGVTRSQGHKVTSIGITFDDGDITNYKNAFPVLNEFGLKAYFFIIGSKINSFGYMTWDKIKELKDAGMIIGSHGMTHRILIGLNDDELDYELSMSKDLLEDNLGISVDSFSIPRGFHNGKIIKKAKYLGYNTIFTSGNRISIKADWEMNYFIKVLKNGYSFKDRAGESIKNSAKRLLGPRNYDKMRTLILK